MIPAGERPGVPGSALWSYKAQPCTPPVRISAVGYYYLNAMILTGETCEVSKTSQVFGDRSCHDYCGLVLPAVSLRSNHALMCEEPYEKLSHAQKHIPQNEGF